MLRAILELVPGGVERYRRPIGMLTIARVPNDHRITRGTYTIDVRNGDTPVTAVIRNFPRRNGAWDLVRRSLATAQHRPEPIDALIDAVDAVIEAVEHDPESTATGQLPALLHRLRDARHDPALHIDLEGRGATFEGADGYKRLTAAEVRRVIAVAQEETQSV